MNCLEHSICISLSKGRRNANKKDLNRDFPKRFDFPAGYKDIAKMEKGREPETIAMMRWIMSEPFVMVNII